MEVAKRSSPARKKDNQRKTPVLNSDGKAFENVPLSNEVQRLRKENEERNAELAIISSVQQGLATKLDMQAIYDLVGDKIREIFHHTDAEIRIYDPRTNLVHFPYITDRGNRIVVDPILLKNAGISSHVLRTGKTLVINEDLMQEMEKYGTTIVPGGHPAKSAVFVPLSVNNQARGLLVLGNVEREHAFSNSDVRLLQTLANSMSTALENARLFDEVQKKNAAITEALERETASNDILRVIAESPTDIQPVLNVIARNAAQLSGSDDAIITLRDGDMLYVDAHYGDVPTFPAGEGMRFNRDSVAGRAILDGHPLQAIHNQQGVKSEYSEGDNVARKYGYRMTCAVPLMRKGKAIGAISIRRIKPELLTGNQIALIQSFANQAAIAVENVRLFNETTRLLKETEERNAELALINSVQSALVAKLNIQGIYDAVGDSLREIFNQSDVGIAIYDDKNNLIYIPYTYEGGKRVMVDSFVLDEQGFIAHVLRTQETLSINENMTQEMEKYGSHIIDGTVMDKSLVYVPLIVGDQARGVISLKDSRREHAFNDSDVRLLTTIANSMSVALENARLFNETQRLLKETEQRNAELAIINSIQQGLAAELDFQALVDLVGDKLRQVFGNSDVTIGIYDPKTDFGSVPYIVENGQRLHIEPFKIEGRGFTGELIRNPRTILINQNMAQEMEKFGSRVLPGTSLAKSMLDVPLLVGGVPRGKLQLQDMNKEGAFTDSDARLLETIANSMSVALENARLFNETQRLLKETEQRAAELAIINSVQAGLASKLDVQAIYDLVGDKIRDIFHAQGTAIYLFDHKTEILDTPYCYLKKRFEIESRPFSEHPIAKSMVNTLQPITYRTVEEYRALGGAILENSGEYKSGMYVPLMVGKELKGMVGIANLDKENAYNDSDLRLLQTLANSMSVALENARLFDETQRLFLEATEARAAAEQANQAKSAFLSSMSHELRTPLNAIINFVEMIARGMIGPVNQGQVELLDQTLQSSKHLLNLINDVLDISKIQAGQLTLFIEDQVSVQVELEATLSIVGGLLQEKGLQLIRDIDPHLPTVSCDRRRVRQVLLNLISNAIKFTDEGTVTVSVKNQRREVLFGVIDTGSGISSDKQDVIFEPFVQTESGERQIQGTGLGLPISRSLVRAHGGELWVDSVRGEGSAFFFTLPVDRSES